MMLKINHKIPTLTECREIASRKSEFKEIKKPGYVVFDYNLNDSHTFDDDGSLEMRGIAFLEDGTLAGLGLHKFFNLGEKPNQNIVLDGTEEILSKLDGSMIRVIKLADGTWRFGTRAGETDVSELADIYVTSLKTSGYDAFIEHCLHLGLWPIFEFWSYENRVVIDYNHPFLKLIAVRTSEGHYLSHDSMVLLAKPFDVPVVTQDVRSVAQIKDVYKGLEGIEGFVIRTNGDWVKAKTENYVFLHRLASKSNTKRQLLKTIYLQEESEVLLYFPQLNIEITEIKNKLSSKCKEIDEYFAKFSTLDRREFAEQVKSNKHSWILFKMKTSKQSAYEVVSKSTFSKFEIFINML